MTASLPPPRNGDQPLERLPTSWTGYQPTGTDQVLPERRRSCWSGSGPPRAAQVLLVFGAGPAGVWCRSCWFLAQVRKQLGDPRRKTASYSLPVAQDPKQKTDLHRSARGPAPEVCGTCATGMLWVRCGQICAATGLWWRYRSCRGGAEGALRANLCSDGTVVALPILSRRGGGEFGGCVWGAAGGRFFAALRMTGSPTGNASHKPNCSDR